MSRYEDLLLHPVRWKIIQSLAGTSATPGELQRKYPEVSQASLYRHIQTLIKAGMIHVASEKKVRGMVERTYSLSSILTDPAETVEGKRSQSALLLRLLESDIDNFLTYSERSSSNNEMSLTRSRIYATDEELNNFMTQLQKLLIPLMDPHSGASAYHMGLVITPDINERQQDG